MRIFVVFRFVCIFVGLGCPLLSLSAGERAASWKVERTPGSDLYRLAATAAIVLPFEDLNAAQGDELKAAVEDLRRLFETRYGTDVAVRERGEGRPKHAVYLEIVAEGADLRGVGEGGFRITQTSSRIYIRAADAEGLVNGIYGFSGKVLGARWYWAGEIGFEWVGEAPTRMRRTRWSETPAFLMRTFYPMNNAFGRRNRLVRHFEFNHALGKVFTPALFEQEPEVFAEVHGRRRPPRGSGGVDPQPDFTEVRTVELAAEAALEHFKRNPESRSFSLSINDNALFDDTAATEARVTPLEYFRGRPNYTDLVFGFMNEVAEQVFDEAGAWETPSGKPRYLTALAYYWTEQSPSFKIHPRVMPVLTSDRAQWHDPEYRSEDKALIRRWADSGAERIATWDYYFGSPYPYPRQFNEWVAESITYMAEAGVTVFFSQLPSAWGLDGGKGWLGASLLWDPEQDAAELLDEYYRHFFGAAAEPIRRFYEIAEEHRNTHEGVAEWIKFYKDEAGIELFPRDLLEAMRVQLEKAEAAVADDSRRGARVQVVSDAFQLTENYARFHRARRNLVEASIAVFGGYATGRMPIGPLLDEYLGARRAHEEYAGRLIEHPLHARLKSFVEMRQSDPAPLALAALARAGEPYAVPEPYVEVARIAEIWTRNPEAFRSMRSNATLESPNDAARGRNFLGPLIPVIPEWHFDFRPNKHLEVVAQAGEGIRVTGADVISVFTDLPVISESDYMLSLSTAYRLQPDNRSQVKLTWKDSSGKTLRVDTPFSFPVGASERCDIVIPVKAPSQAYDVRVHVTVSRQYPGDFLELKKIDFGLIAE